MRRLVRLRGDDTLEPELSTRRRRFVHTDLVASLARSLGHRLHCLLGPRPHGMEENPPKKEESDFRLHRIIMTKRASRENQNIKSLPPQSLPSDIYA